METPTDTIPASLMRRAFLPAAVLLAMTAAYVIAPAKNSAQTNQIAASIEAARDAAHRSDHAAAITIAHGFLTSDTDDKVDKQNSDAAVAILRASLLATTQPLVLKAHDGPLTALLFIDNGARLATASGVIAGADPSIKIWMRAPGNSTENLKVTSIP